MNVSVGLCRGKHLVGIGVDILKIIRYLTGKHFSKDAMRHIDVL